MKILGIETSCDETAAAIVEDGRTVLAETVHSQIVEHQKYGGVVPEIASRCHVECICQVVEETFLKANLTFQDIDAIAVTAAPGLIGALLVGVNYAKGLAMSTNKPLVPVHHIRGHVAANYIAHPDLIPPFLCLVASGGHSHIVVVHSYTEFEVVGRTRDDAAGEAFDKAARVLGLPYPGGIYIDEVSKQGDPFAYQFPHPKAEGPYDFSFSGLKTAVINLVHNKQQKNEPYKIEDVAASFQETVAQILTDKLMKAAEHYRFDTVAIAGGVSANSSLRAHLQKACLQSGRKLYAPPLKLCGDNASMIACQGYYEFLAGARADMSLNGCASRSINEGAY